MVEASGERKLSGGEIVSEQPLQEHNSGRVLPADASIPDGGTVAKRGGAGHCVPALQKSLGDLRLHTGHGVRVAVRELH